MQALGQFLEMASDGAANVMGEAMLTRATGDTAANPTGGAARRFEDVLVDEEDLRDAGAFYHSPAVSDDATLESDRSLDPQADKTTAVHGDARGSASTHKAIPVQDAAIGNGQVLPAARGTEAGSTGNAQDNSGALPTTDVGATPAERSGPASMIGARNANGQPGDFANTDSSAARFETAGDAASPTLKSEASLPSDAAGEKTPTRTEHNEGSSSARGTTSAGVTEAGGDRFIDVGSDSSQEFAGQHAAAGEAGGDGTDGPQGDAVMSGSVAKPTASTSRAAAVTDAGRVDAARVVDQLRQGVIEHLTASNGGADERLEVRLNPPELGSVWIRIDRTDGGLVAQLSVQDPVVRAALESQIVELRQALVDAGIGLTEFELARDDGGTGDRRPDARFDLAQPRNGNSAQNDVAGDRSQRMPRGEIDLIV